MSSREFRPPEEKTSPVLFFVIGILMVAVTFWAVWDEIFTRRPWKNHQVEFNQIESRDLAAKLSKSREKRVAYPRQIVMYLMREMAHRSLVEIGTFLGGRDHSTVHHGWRKMERSQSVDPETKRDISSLRELVEQARQVA